MTASTESPVSRHAPCRGGCRCWLLGVVTAAVAYVTGIAAGRRLGSRLASFVALLEVVFGCVFAWLLLGELPRPIQLVGGVLILAGVVAVKLGERSSGASRPTRRSESKA